VENINPTIISFYTTNSPYYMQWGEKFIKRINHLNAEAEQHGKPTFNFAVQKMIGNLSWSDACCQKPKFIRDKLIEHDRILWIDIDSHLSALPTNIIDCNLSVGWEKHYALNSRIGNLNSDMVLCDVCYAQNDSCSRDFFDEVIKKVNERVKNGNPEGDHGDMLDIWYKFRNSPTCGSTFDFIDASWRTIGISGNERPGMAAHFRNTQKQKAIRKPRITNRSQSNPRRKR